MNLSGTTNENLLIDALKRIDEFASRGNATPRMVDVACILGTEIADIRELKARMEQLAEDRRNL